MACLFFPSQLLYRIHGTNWKGSEKRQGIRPLSLEEVILGGTPLDTLGYYVVPQETYELS
jgi:hypothetical protein